MICLYMDYLPHILGCKMINFIHKEITLLSKGINKIKKFYVKTKINKDNKRKA